MTADKLFEFLCDVTYIPKKHENGEPLTEEEKMEKLSREITRMVTTSDNHWRDNFENPELINDVEWR